MNARSNALSLCFIVFNLKSLISMHDFADDNILSKISFANDP